jgi:hypothetical protein
MLVALGCGEAKDEGTKVVPEKRGAAPPSATTKPAGTACSRKAIDDATTAKYFPGEIGGFCLDPADGGKAMGEGAKAPLEAMCDLFDGECAVYEAHGVKRVVALRYVSSGGSQATIDVVLSKFGSPSEAYAMFTKRTVGDGDPADEAAPKPIEGGGAAALGVGNAYLWRGEHLAEITYADTAASPADMEKAGSATLPPLVKAIGDALPGDTAQLPDVALLPKPDRIPIGVRFVADEAIRGVKLEGKGAGAVGYYRAGDKRWRVIAAARADEAAAKELMAAISKAPGAEAVTGLGDEAVRVEVKDGATAVEWLAARKGARVFAVGDEPRALRSGASAEERAKISLGQDEKKAKLEPLLAAP